MSVSKQMGMCVISGAVGAVVALTISHALAASEAPIQDKVRVRQLELVDKTGHVWAALMMNAQNQPQFGLYGDKGSVEARTDEFGGRFSVMGDQGQASIASLNDRMALSVTPKKNILGSSILLASNDGDSFITVSGKTASILVSDEKGFPRGWLKSGLSDKPLASIELFDASHNAVWKAP